MHAHAGQHRVALTGLAFLIALTLLVSLILVFAHLGALTMLWNPDLPSEPVTPPLPDAWRTIVTGLSVIQGVFLT